MSLRLALRHAPCRIHSVQSSYVEISRFIRTRRHGITLNRAASVTKDQTRLFSNSKSKQDAIEPNDSLRLALDNFKNTIQPLPWNKLARIDRGFDYRKPETNVTVFGYLNSCKDVSKKLSFATIRNMHQTLCVQVVASSQDDVESEVLKKLRCLREWTPVLATGTIQERKGAKESQVRGLDQLSEREIVLDSIEPVNDIPADLIIKEETAFPPEQRHLQLRTGSELRKNLKFRNRVTLFTRNHLKAVEFQEIETPILFKSTPEGAREFLVPSRNKGLAYALPQSPQQYKQILMASGIPRYFQFARCFRDEDLRADRQPEFTQLDLEMAWSGEEDVMETVERMIRYIWKFIMGFSIPPRGPFPRMTYQQAMATYGSDKPDIRFDNQIHNITQHLPADLIGKISDLENPTVDCFKMKVSDDPKVTKQFISEFLDSPEGKAFLENPDGQPGVFISNLSQPMQGLGPLGYPFVMEKAPDMDIGHGDLFILQARKTAPLSGGSTVLGNLRLALHKAAIEKGLVKPYGKKDFKFLWITDFPLFSPSTDTEPGQGGAAGLSSTHHPFTAPKTAEDVEMLLTDPQNVTAAHYDLVCNGVEIGGGSRRIHNAQVQEFILRDVLKMRQERIEDFRHLLDVLRSGCPPHAGIALGWDRLLAMMRGKESVRDVIAFPKSGRGEDLLVKSPNAMTVEQLDTYHLKLRE